MNASEVLHATIIGGQGFVGQRLFHYLTEQGWNCWVPQKNDPELFERPLGYVFYCAGLTADYARRSFDTVDAHVSLLNAVLHRAEFASLVYLSSTRLYDGLQKDCVSESDNLTVNPANPRHIYDLSKALGEALCFSASQGKAKVARLSCVYHDAQDADGFLPQLLRSVIDHRGQGSLTMETSAAFARDYVSLDDVVRGLVDICVHGREKIYNLASGENISNADLFDLIHDLTGVEVIPASAAQAGSSPVINMQRFVTEFGWQPASLRKRLSTLLKA